MKSKRKPWNQYFMEHAEKASERATCDRLHVGCVLVRNNKIISTGYNGALSKQKHCSEVGCLFLEETGKSHCRRILHGEINALLSAAYEGISTKDAVAYVNWHPCFECLKALIAAGIKKIYYKDIYKPELVAKYPKEIMEIIPIEQITY